MKTRTMWSGIKITLLTFSTLTFINTSFSQPKYGMDFSGPWQWDDLTNVTINQAREMAPVTEDIRSTLTISDARVLFKELTLLTSLDELKNLSAIALEDDSSDKLIWSEKIEEEFGYFSTGDNFASLLDAAVRLMRLRTSMVKNIPEFKSRDYLPQPINLEFGNLRLDFDYSAADDVILLFESPEIKEDKPAEIISSYPYRVYFETRRARTTSEELKADLRNATKNGPLYNIYKWLNPRSFSGFGGVSLHPYQYQSVMQSVQNNNENIQKYIIERVGKYLPDDFPLYSQVFFMVGSNEPAWFNDNGAIGISLEYFGDEYEYLVSYLIHEFYSLAEDNIQIPIYEFVLSGNDWKFMKLIRDITRVGTANYVGPIGSQNRPSDLLEKDFRMFNSTYSELYNGSATIADSMILQGFEGVGPFYTMGTQMAYIIENTSGRKALIESIKMGPVHFFKNYIEAYKDSPDEIRKVFRFSKKVEEKIEKLSRIFTDKLMGDALELKNLTSTPSLMEEGIQKYIKRYSGENASLVNLIVAQLYLEAGDYQKSQDYFIRGLGKSNVANSSDVIGTRFMNKKAFPEALKFFDMYVENQPNNPYAYEIRGECYYKANDFEKARIDFEKALELDPDLSVASIYLEKIP